MRRKLTEEDLERMRVPKRHWNARFDMVSGGDKVSLRSTIERYFADFENTAGDGFGLLLFGPNGTGKTAAGVVALKEFRRRLYSAMFVEAAEMKTAVFGNVPFDDTESMWERMKSVDVLLIDDVGKGVEDNKGAFARLLDELIRHRSSNMRVTWMTTNMTIPDFEEFVKTSTMHAIREAMVPVRVTGVDLRNGASRGVERILAG